MRLPALVKPFASLTLAAVALVACGDSTDVESTTRVEVLLTDAPSEYIAEAMVDIGAVELVGGDGDEDRVVLSEDGTDGPVNLLDLQNEATLLLASSDIEAGSYAQIRLIVEDATVTLAEGYEFNGGGTTMTLQIPSGAQTGIKLNLKAGEGDADDDEDGVVEIEPGDLLMVVDFDVNRSFVIQGNPETPAGINGVLFKPTLRVIVNDEVGTISGSVFTSVPETSVEGLVVTATPVEDDVTEEFQSATATALTDAEGSYTLHFLVPGEYEISVETAAGLVVTPVTVTVGESEAVVDVDLEIIEG